MSGSGGGTVTIGVLLVIPSLFASLFAQMRVSRAVEEHRRGIQAATDGARLAGQRVAETWNEVALAGRLASADQATLLGLEGLAAAAATRDPAEAARYAARVVEVEARAILLGTVQARALGDAGTVVAADLAAAGAERGFDAVQMEPPLLSWSALEPAEACRRSFDADPLLGGLAPAGRVEVVASGLAARYPPWGPAAFAGAFAAAVSRCTVSGIPGLALAEPLERARHDVVVTRAGGQSLATFEVWQAGSSGEPDFHVRLLTGREAGDGAGGHPLRGLTP